MSGWTRSSTTSLTPPAGVRSGEVGISLVCAPIDEAALELEPLERRPLVAVVSELTPSPDGRRSRSASCSITPGHRPTPQTPSAATPGSRWTAATRRHASVQPPARSTSWYIFLPPGRWSPSRATGPSHSLIARPRRHLRPRCHAGHDRPRMAQQQANTAGCATPRGGTRGARRRGTQGGSPPSALPPIAPQRFYSHIPPRTRILCFSRAHLSCAASRTGVSSSERENQRPVASAGVLLSSLD